MLTQAGCRERQARLWQRLPDEILWVLIGDSRHVQYFSNFRINPFSFSADQKSLLLLTSSFSSLPTRKKGRRLAGTVTVWPVRGLRPL